MARKTRVHISRHFVAYIALFVALGGTSYAAVRLPAGSVGAKQLKNGAVTGPKLKDGAVTGRKLRRGSLTAADLSAKARQSLKGAKGDKGDPGASGSPGAGGQQGVVGPTGPSDGYFTSHEAATTLSFNFSSGGTSVAHLDVPAGSYLVSAKVDLTHSVPGDSISEGCILKAESDTNGDDVFIPGGGSSDIVVPYQTAHTFASAGGIDLNCYVFGITGGDSGSAQHVRLTAVKVGTLHVQ